MTNNLITWLIINNLTLIHFVGFEDIKIKNNAILIKKYIIITITSLLIYSISFYLYKLLEKNNFIVFNANFLCNFNLHADIII